MSSVQVVMAASDPQRLFHFCLLDTVHCSKSYKTVPFSCSVFPLHPAVAPARTSQLWGILCLAALGSGNV